MIKNLTILFVLWIIFSISSFAQQRNYRFINFTHTDGLSDKAVYNFAQDGKGFIWMGTASGLYRYDGHTFKHYRSDKESEYAQISNILQNILYDETYNRLWLSSTTDFQYFDLTDYKFYRADGENLQSDRTYSASEMITSMSKVSKNILWLGSTKGIKSYDVLSKQWTSVDRVFKDAPADFTPSILKIHAVSPDTVLISTNSHLIIHNPITHTSEFIKPMDLKSIPDFFYDSAHQCIWICTGLNLIKLDIKDKSQTIIKRKGLENLNFTYYKICPFGNDKLWISGSVIFDIPSGEMKFIPYGESKFDNQLLYVNSLFVDKQNNLWRGSYESSCSVLPFQNHSVVTFPMTNIDESTLNGANLEVFQSLKLRDQDFILIVGNPLKGIIRLNLKTGEKSLISLGLHPKSSFGVDILQAQDGSIYFADNITTYIVDLNQNSLNSIHKYADETTGNNFRKLLMAKPNILIECNNNRLTFYNTNTSETIHSDIDKIDPNRNKFEDYYFRPCIVTRNGTIYYTSTSGLFEQKNIEAPILKSSAFTSDTGKKLIKPQGMVEDEEGNIWITSLVNGLFKYIKSEEQLLNFNASNSAIGSDYLQSIALEPHNIITVGSTSQLYRFDAKTGRFLNSFNKQNGFSRDDQAYGFIVQNSYFVKNNYGSIDVLDLAKYPTNLWSQKPIFTSISILGREQLLTPTYRDTTYYLNHDENQISISFATINLANSSNNRYKYRLLGLDTSWTIDNEPIVTYSRLPYGHFTFEVYGINSDGVYSEEISRLNFEIAKPFYLSWWFIFFILAVIGATIWSFYRLNVKKIQNENKIKRAFDKQVLELEMKALRAQMNPHFIFNSLNSIQRFIFEKDEYAASQYLTKFSRLIRHILDQSNQAFISLQSELELLKLYVEMENLRFDNKFEFELNIGPEINTSWMVPSMVIQAHLENAIWHGLLHKEDKGVLILSFYQYSVNQIIITIEDNGVGRQKSLALKSKQLLKKKSYGSQISSSRIEHLNNLYEVASSINIIDLEDKEHPNINGTKIEIIIPIIENKES